MSAPRLTRQQVPNTKWPREKALKVRDLISKFNICSCGSDAHWECVLELLVEAENHSDKGFYRDKWFEFGAKVLDAWGLLDHGTGIGFSFLTDEGKLFLEFLRDFGTADHDLNDETGQPATSIATWISSAITPDRLASMSARLQPPRAATRLKRLAGKRLRRDGIERFRRPVRSSTTSGPGRQVATN